jgi:hypothetical protein
VPADSTIFVLTDTPALYGDDLNHAHRRPVFVSDVATLLSRLKDVEAAGLVLEIGKVMRAGRAERDRLFSYAGCYPVLRTKPNPRVGFVAYLDPRDRFLANLDDCAGKRLRAHERADVLLDCHFSREDDPSMVAAQEGVILDISPGGCFIKTNAGLGGESFIHVRIPGLASRRPIYSSIRWCSADSARPGLGIMFIDIAEAQVREIEAMRAAAGA